MDSKIENLRKLLQIKPKTKEQQKEFLTGQNLMKKQFGSGFVNATAKIPDSMYAKPNLGKTPNPTGQKRCYKINLDSRGRPMNAFMQNGRRINQ